MFRKSFNSSKCKTLLKLIASRIKIVRNKHEIQLRHMQMDVFQLLQKGQDDSALTRVENVIREQNIVDALNIIQMYSELIINRMSLIDAQKVCPVDLQEAVSSLLYAGPRCAELPELLKVRKLFVRKYGQDFVTAAMELHSNSGVSKKIIEKLNGRPPSRDTKEYFLKKIALENGLQWNPSSLRTEPLKSHEDMPGRPSAAKAADSIPSKSTKSDLSQVDPKMQNPFPAATPDPHVGSRNKPAPQAKVDDSISRRNVMITSSTYPDKPMLTSDEPDEALGSRQFIPFVPIHVGNSAATFSEIGNSTVVASRKNSRNAREDMPNQNHVDQLNADDEESRGSRSSYYKAVASAAEAAAISAENAALAARAAVKLAHSGLSRESSMVSDTEENEIDLKHATTVPIQENLHKTRLTSDINQTGGARNPELRSLNPMKQRESIASKSSDTKQITTEVWDEEEDDLGMRHHSKAVLFQTSSESEQELENIDPYDSKKKVGNSSLIDRSSLKLRYHQQSSRGYAAASREPFQEDYIVHDQAYRQRNEVMSESSWHEPEEFPSWDERRDLFSTSKGDKHEKDPLDADRLQRLDSEISRPIFDEDFRYKSRLHMEEFYRTEMLENPASLQQDDEDGAIWSKEKVQTTSKQKTLKPRVVPPRAVEIFESGTDSEIDEVPISRRSFSPPSRFHRTGGTQRTEYFADHGNDEPRASKTLYAETTFETDETPTSGRSFTPPSQSYKIATTGKTGFFTDYAGDEPSSPVYDENGSKSSYENSLYIQNIRGGSKIQKVPQNSDYKNFTSKRNLFRGQVAKQNLDSAFEPEKISSHGLSMYSDDSDKDEDQANQSSAAQSVQLLLHPTPRVIPPVYDPGPSNEEIGSTVGELVPVAQKPYSSMQVEKNMTKPLDNVDGKKIYNLSTRPRIGESVRSRRTK